MIHTGINNKTGRGNEVFVNEIAISELYAMHHTYLVESNRAGLQQWLTESYGIEQPYFSHPYYVIRTTQSTAEQIAKQPGIIRVIRQTLPPTAKTDLAYAPLAYRLGTNHQNLPRITVPKKGTTIEVNAFTLAVYADVIGHHEGLKNVSITLGPQAELIIDGKKMTKYTFRYDYYFLVGMNLDGSWDSKQWGFLPESHIIGRVDYILWSLDERHYNQHWMYPLALITGGMRNRWFRTP